MFAKKLMNGNTKILQAVSEAESKVWKHEECAGNTDVCCSACLGMDRTALESMAHHSQDQRGKLKARA